MLKTENTALREQLRQFTAATGDTTQPEPDLTLPAAVDSAPASRDESSDS